ncbi:MAG: D-aminoacyl-tRNA deacylase [Paracoccaceae bacterium]|nr:D-aminoacyl-tRNA deacylase [Paracoccaceae bacterium]
MRALIQRVTKASVQVDSQVVGQIDQGLLILLCAMAGDTETEVEKLASKVTKLRIFMDENGKMNRSIIDIAGAALVVSQFTLAADTSRGNRPGFSHAANPDDGRKLYEYFIVEMQNSGTSVETGEFGADMRVSLINDGPATFWMDTSQS